MSIFSDMLTKLMDRRDMSDSELASLVDVNRTTVSRWRSGERSPKMEKLPEIAAVFNVDPRIFVGENLVSTSIDNDITTIYNELKPPRKEVVYKFAERQLQEQNQKPKVVQLPIVEDDKEIEILSGHQSAAGFAILGDDYNMTSTVMKASKVPNGADEVVEIKGNSMEPLIMDGEQVFIRHQPSVENGEIAIVAIFDDGITCKKVYYDDAEGTVTLESVNDDYEDMVFPVEDIRIIGKVLGK
ncbi:helix-turn-helix domain-containing protein [Carnobacterium maltaromaticum]|uniref:helix-turn-helix domain-containing protein n=1 Tax=Carnobacterium maltaromaticum TaxID=2751 RepID=UPI00215317D5|nr:XRE family transcriptional regulator [Carnobacterium maltaromaticum]